MRVKNWEKFQHYKVRNPVWIKLHRTLLDDPLWFALDGDAWKMLAMCWMVAAENGGELPDSKTLAWRLRLPLEWIEQQLTKLSEWLLADDARGPLEVNARGSLEVDASTVSGDRASTRREENKREKRRPAAPAPVAAAPPLEPGLPAAPPSDGSKATLSLVARAPSPYYAIEIGDRAITHEQMAEWQTYYGRSVHVEKEVKRFLVSPEARKSDWFSHLTNRLAFIEREMEKAKLQPKAEKSEPPKLKMID